MPDLMPQPKNENKEPPLDPDRKLFGNLELIDYVLLLCLVVSGALIGATLQLVFGGCYG